MGRAGTRRTTMKIDFTTTEGSEGRTMWRAIHGSNSAILGAGANERRALLDVLESVRKAFFGVGAVLDADVVAQAMSRISERCDREERKARKALSLTA